MSPPMRAALLSCVLALAASAAAAQDLAVTNARLLTAGPAGEIASGAVVIRGGRITAVGPNAPVPAGMRTIDAGGRTVTPGLVATNTTLSVAEINQIEATNDYSSGSPGISAAFDVQYGINPASTVIPVSRLGGITRAIVTPGLDGGGESPDGDPRESLFAGQGAVIHLGQGTDILVRANIAQFAALGDQAARTVGGSRGSAIVALNTALDDVRAYQRNRAAFDRGESRELALSRADLEALIPVVEGRMPLVVSVSRAADIRGALKLARERNLRLIIESGEEAWAVASELAAARVPVILNPTADLPSRFETAGATLENARRLHEAGVVVAIAGDRTGHYARQARYNAGIAVANGLPYAEALKAITLNPARIYGVEDRFGSIETGKDGDLVIWDGDPFEPMTRAVNVVIRGVEQPMTSRQIQLRDRYLRREPNSPAAYR